MTSTRTLYEGASDIALVVDNQVLLRPKSGAPDSVLVTTSTAGTYPAFPAWSPDGSRLAYVEKHFPTGTSPTEDWGDDIVVIAASGGSPQVVHRHREPTWQVYGLDWTPDSGALVFGDLRPIFENGRFTGSSARLTRLDLTTRNESLLLDHAYAPSFSRDGKRLAYFGAADGYGTGGLVVADGDGGNAQVVVPSGTFSAILFPRLSPDGTAIVFAAAERFGAQFSPPTPSRRRTLGDVLFAIFRPARASAHGLPMDIWSVDVRSKVLTRLTRIYEDDPCPDWSPDGAAIIAVGVRGQYLISRDGSMLQTVGPGAYGAQLDVRP